MKSLSSFCLLSEVAGYTVSRSRTLRHSGRNRVMKSPSFAPKDKTKRKSIGEVKKVTESTEDVKGPVLVQEKLELADIEPRDASNQAIVQVG